ncbi:TonB-dependent receptor plug domain-containing protein [Parabacteroides sp. PF5-6]|uniref:TonB-dependent receptor plug domain-containing protein n=1 Tax=Parabacteroides sp. PF5-6 TaxID=1742403 RepID=UPI0024073644|nr:TonB-dependent receptor plug domain-containing protein [Parabacteroides sp. PF5-6]MDF9828924.1 hypothetical protein [Parabacteroides sp. PF5-6]
MRKYLVRAMIILSCVCAQLSEAQHTLTHERVMEQMETQLSVYPLEKLHLHLDRTSFFQGEKIWFKAYLTDAFLLPSQSGSRYVYVELINPAGLVAERVMVRSENELFQGNLPLPEDLIEGNYTLRAYTRYMKNMGEDHYFRKTIQVNSVMGAQIRPHYVLDYKPERRKAEVELYYTVGHSAEKIKPDRLQFLTWKEQLQSIRMDKDTIARFTYDLSPDEDAPAVIHLEADNFRHYIPLTTTQEDYEVIFYPEGGYMINGALTRMTFKAMNSAGLAEEITGTVYNQKGERTAEIKTTHAGMGLLAIVAKADESYYVECTNKNNVKKRFDLPKGVSGTFGIRTNTNKNHLIVGLTHASDTPVPDDLTILIHKNGEVYFFDRFPSAQKEMVLPWDMLSHGVLQVMLLNKDLNPLSERLVFSPLKEKTIVRITPDKAIYHTREKISIDLDLENENEMPLYGNLSVAITDRKDVDVDHQLTIASTLLLTSELKGHIENPAYYLRQDDPKAAYALDLLLMTQGWRRYDIPQAIQGHFIYPEVVPESTQELTGTITRIQSTKPIANGEVALMLKYKDREEFFDQATTNEKGEFAFAHIEYSDSTKLFIQALNEKGKEQVQVNLDKITYPPVEKSDRPYMLTAEKEEESLPAEEDLNLILKKAEERAKYDENMQIINLKEVVVTAGRIERTSGAERSHYASENTTVIDFAKELETKYYSSLTELFYEVPGVRIALDADGNKRILIRESVSLDIESQGGYSFARVFIEGMPTEDAGILDRINIYEVASVEVYKGTEAAVFGMLGGTGVVNIIYKKETKVAERPTFNKLTTALPGYQRAVEFYAPKYETPEQRSSFLPDLRTTIYWKPDLFTNEDGKARFEFYSADTPTVYDIVFEGLTNDGLPVRKVESIRIE